MNRLERYNKCVVAAKKINSFLDKGAIVLDYDGEILDPDGRFIFEAEETQCYLGFLVVTDGCHYTVSYCGVSKHLWIGEPSIMKMRKFKVCKKFEKII